MILTIAELKSFMIGYEITDVPDAILTTLIEDSEREIQDLIGPFDSTKQKTIRKAGGGIYIHLPYRNFQSLDSITNIYEDSVSTIQYETDIDSGTIRAKSGYTFAMGPYTIIITIGFSGSPPAEIKTAVKYMSAIFSLVYLSGQYGGGNLSMEGVSSSFGEFGEFSESIQFFYGRLKTILDRYLA